MLTALLSSVLLAGALIAPTPSLVPSLAPVVAPGTSDPGGPIEVVGDPAEAAYVGTGGLLVDSTFTGDPGDRRRLAECSDCRWWLTPVCWRDPRNTDASCRVVATCPPGWVQMGIWFASAMSAARVVGRYCLGPAGPVTPGRITASLAGRFVRRLPPLRPGDQPAVSITGLATLFRSGQPANAGPWRYSVVGCVVTLWAATTWTWTFGDGATLVTREPGGTYPTRTVAHLYRRSGAYRVSVRSGWVGQYVVGAFGPFTVAPPVSQTVSFTVLVRQARAVLINPA